MIRIADVPEVDLYYVALAVIVLTIVAFVVRAVRLTNASMSTASRLLNLTRPDIARRLVEEIRVLQVPCDRCGQQTFALLGTENRYKCEIVISSSRGRHTCPLTSRGITDRNRARSAESWMATLLGGIVLTANFGTGTGIRTPVPWLRTTCPDP